MALIKVDLKPIEQKEKIILKEEMEIQKTEKKLIFLEKYLQKILGKEIRQAEVEGENLALEETFIQKEFIKRAQRHKILFPLVILCAVVLVWHGLWGIFDSTPVISQNLVSLGSGIGLLWLFNKFTNL